MNWPVAICDHTLILMNGTLQSISGSSDSFFEILFDVQQSYAARIVRGNITSIKHHPHHVFIMMWIQRNDGYTNYKSYCGGSIISSKWILTAGHCRGWNMEVVAGSDIINEGNRYRVKKYMLFPEYLRIEGKSHYDYLLLELYEHLHFDSSIRPIKLGSWSDIVNGVMANVTGFGKTSEGDSGGGLVVSGKLVGVVSHQRGCARLRKPTVYSAIPYAENWICSATGICPTNRQETIIT